MKPLPGFFCPKPWKEMAGDERERFCDKCQKTVHNLELLSFEQRIDLLRASNGDMCGRYRMAVRRARKGHEESHMRHLAKYGAGVALTSAAWVTVWQLHSGDALESSPTFRVANSSGLASTSMPADFYDEAMVFTLGFIVCIEAPEPSMPAPSQPHLDLKLDPEPLETSSPPYLEFQWSQ